jgi:hypothetical protein
MTDLDRIDFEMLAAMRRERLRQAARDAHLLGARPRQSSRGAHRLRQLLFVLILAFLPVAAVVLWVARL